MARRDPTRRKTVEVLARNVPWFSSAANGKDSTPRPPNEGHSSSGRLNLNNDKIR